MAEVRGIHKRFGGRDVVRDVSFTVDPGYVLGMVGPNGAGKTTTIRMLLDIIQPDHGEVRLFGKPFSGGHRAMIGYLPEERGLYRDLDVRETLEYLGALKGLHKAQAKRSAAETIERLGMHEHRSKKVKELSRGMSQLIQVAAAIQHRPRLLVLDEPFSGLDPVNVRLLKEVLEELRDDGAAIVLSTHQMNLVEEFCDRVLMINDGQVVLYGHLDEVRRDFADGSILVDADPLPAHLPGVVSVTDRGSHKELVMAGEAPTGPVLRALAESGCHVRRFEIASPPLEEIFVRIVRHRR